MSEESTVTSKTCRRSARIQRSGIPVEPSPLNRRGEDEAKENTSIVSEEPAKKNFKICRRSVRTQQVGIPVELDSLNKRREDEAKEDTSERVMSEEPPPETRRRSLRLQGMNVSVDLASLKGREEDERRENLSEKAPLLSCGEMALADLEAGRIWTQVIWNDLTTAPIFNVETLVMLNRLRELFSIQLPMMPVEYITRVVFDSFHRCLVLCRKEKGVIGGICYRPFEERGFIEIVFCAVSSEEQVKGYGTLLMDRLKHYQVAERGIKHFVTYADNFAIGYFRRQGFDNETADWSLFEGCIKSYSGAQFMGWHADRDVVGRAVESIRC